MASGGEACERDKQKKEVENGMRLCVLLINEGTRTVKRKFQEKLAPNNLSSLLKQQNIKQKLYSLFMGKGKVPKLLNEVQYKLLYPQKGVPDAGKFDLTLLTFLFRNILYEQPPPSTNSWHDDPDEMDTSLAADLVRLRKMRNSLYGHIAKMGLSDAEFEVNWNKLAAVLVRLGCKQDDIDSVKRSSLASSREITQLQITTLIENDLGDIQSILYILQISVFQNNTLLESQSTEVQALVTEILDDAGLSEADWSFKTAKILELLSLLPVDITKYILKNMNSSKNQILEHLKEMKSLQIVENERLNSHLELQDTQLKHIEETSSKTVNAVENLTKNLVSKELHTTMKRQVSEIQEDVKQIRSQQHKVQDTHIIEIERYLKDNQNALKILIYNKPDVLDEHSDIKDAFCFALGSVPWDFIIDLDHCSRTKGIFDMLANILKKKKDFKVVTYADSAKITDEDKNIIASGLKTLWLLANGCEEVACPPSEKQFGACITEIYSLLKSIISRLSKIRSLFTLNVIMSDTMKKPITRLFRTLTDISEAMNDRVNIENSCAMSIYFDVNHGHIVPVMDSDVELRHVSNQLSPAQLLCLLSESFPSSDIEKKFYFPGDKSMCYLTAQEMAKMQPYLQLFHTNIGEISLEDIEIDKREEMIDNIKLNFLKGNELSAEAIFIHEKVCQVYVQRTEMDEIKRVVEKELEAKQYKFTTEQRYVEVLHDASGSGTTTGIFLLYKLREQYPCIEVKVIDNNTVNSLKKISRDSRKPLLVVVDSTSYRPSDLHSLQNRLENEMIKCVIVHIRRKNPSDKAFDVSKEAASNGKCYISSKLQHEMDMMAFRKLYDTIRKSITADRVYLFGLIAFCGDYTRLNKHILQSLENMTPCQKDAVTLVYLVRKLCHVKVEGILLRNLFDPAVKKCGMSSLLGNGEDLLVFDSVGSVRPAHECLIEPYMEIVEKEQMRPVVMTNFMDNLYKIFSSSSTSLADSLRLLHELFIQREKPKEEFFSTLLELLGERCGKDYVKEQILRFIKLYSGISKEAHLRGLYARYLMHRMNNPDESIEQIKIAVGFKTTQSITEAKESGPLITTYAGLFRSYGHHIFKQMNLNSDTTAEQALQGCLGHFEESVRAFQLAQKIMKGNYKDAKYTPIPFIGEAKARYAVLNLIFHNICKKNHRFLQHFIKTSKNHFLSVCEKEAMEALVNLEWLIFVDKVHDDQLIFTRQIITELKFKLLLLRYDEGIEIHKLLKTLGPDVPCDIGMLIRLEATTLTTDNLSTITKHWEDLGEEKLLLIIKTINKRMSKSTISMLSCNYRDLLIAMIHLRQIKGPSKFRNYNIDLALNIASAWISAFPHDGFALFHIGAILLVQGIEKKNVDIIKEAIKTLNDCDEFYKKYLSKRNLKAVKYAIGNGVGLGMLIPYHISKTSNDLKRFLGRQIGKKYVAVRPFNGVLTALLPDKFNSGSFKTDQDQQPVLKFSIYLRESFPTISTKPDIEVASPEEIAMSS